MITPKPMFGKYLSLFVLLLTCTYVVQAQKDPLVTDRPDQTEAPIVVGKGVFQVETGAVLSKMDVFVNSHDDYLRTREFATTLLRYGISDRIELRFISGYTIIDHSSDPISISGFQPLALGTKVSLARESGIWPEVAFIGHLTLPWIGDDFFVPEKVAPDFRFSFAHTLSDRFALGYNAGMEWDGDGGDANFIYTISLGAGLFGPVSGFVELFGESEGQLVKMDYGLTVLVSPDIQFDISHGFDLGGVYKERFLSAGVSLRIGAE